MWLELRGYLAGVSGPGRPVEVGAGATVRDLLASLAIRPSEVGLVVVNGRAADPDRRLREGDRILVWPLVVGG
ncbi:MAG: sulfur carrier protein ThiS [Desulfotomaculales bacterium]